MTQTNEANISDNQNLIGDTVSVKFTSLPGYPALKAKVDTGADLCSLHADQWAIRGDKIAFVCKKLSPNTLTLPLRDQQAVKSASGMQYRPVIELSIKVNDKILQNVLFNITDRKGMDFPVLLGRNALEKGKFLIDPSLAESEAPVDTPVDGPVPELGPRTNDAASMESNQDSEQEDPKEQKLKQIYDLIKDSDITFGDLIKYIRTQVTNTFEDIEY